MRKITPLILAFLTLATSDCFAQSRCSPESLKGQYVFTGRGYIEPGDPGVERVHGGVLLFDGAGKVSGKQSSSRGGKIGHERLQGTYALDSDCSGTMTFGSVARPGAEIHWDVYVTSEGRLGHMIRTDEGSMAVRDFQK